MPAAFEEATVLQLQSIPVWFGRQSLKLLSLLRIRHYFLCRTPPLRNDNPSRFSTPRQQHAWSFGGFCSRCGRDRFSRTGTRDMEWCTGEGAADHVRNALQLLQVARFRSRPDAEHVDAILDHTAYMAALERLI